MSSEWDKFTLAEAPLTIMDGDRGANYPSQADFSPVGYCLFLNTGNVTTEGFNFSNCAFITKEKDAALRKGKLVRGDVVLTTRGTVGNVANFNNCVPFENVRINSGMVILRPEEQKISSHFLYLFLRSSIFKQQVKSLQSGSAQPQLPIRDMKRIEMPIPPRYEQEAICAMLGSLDDRITLLRETNATLEAIAQALFKSWFVDFDPVHAKQQGRAPEGMDAQTAALFPDAFEESELGMVPKGWNWSTLAECTSYLNRGISPKYVEEGGIPVLNQKCIRDFSVDFSKARRHDPALRKIDGRDLMKGDVLVNSTGVGTLGRVAQLLKLDEPTIVDSHVTVVRAGQKINAEYLGCFMQWKQPNIEDMGEGSTGQTELSRQKLGQLEMLQPDEKTLLAFRELVNPLKERISFNEKSIGSLAQLRDTLLPRLISGQLHLPEAQALVEDAVDA